MDYTESSSEKMARGKLFDVLQKELENTKVVIVDAPNYIKGYRYQMYCLALETKVRTATVMRVFISLLYMLMSTLSLSFIILNSHLVKLVLPFIIIVALIIPARGGPLSSSVFFILITTSSHIAHCSIVSK